MNPLLAVSLLATLICAVTDPVSGLVMAGFLGALFILLKLASIILGDHSSRR